uniref:Uncharacterized protein n=1 Tax=Strigamia maritima TaxID=126957 RepID=T1IQ06_STRMM
MGLLVILTACFGFISLISIPTYYRYKGANSVSFFQKLFGDTEDEGDVKDWFSTVFTLSSFANSQSQEVIRLWGWSLKLPPCWDTVATFMIMIWLYSYLLNVWCADLWNDLMEYPRFRNAINSLILLLVIAPAAGFTASHNSASRLADSKANLEKLYMDQTMEQDDKTQDSDTEDNRLLKYEETVAAMLEQINMEDDGSD